MCDQHYVIPRSVAAHYRSMLEQINTAAESRRPGDSPRFANGGLIARDEPQEDA